MVGVDQSEAAEAVRQHLVSLRGGAPFLSPEDADLLRTWLDRGVTTPQIVLALERAADARRRRPRRTPLSLSSARRHLNKGTRGALAPSPSPPEPTAHPLQPLVGAILARATEDARADELRALADRLAALPIDDRILLEIQAQALLRDFMLKAWESMSRWERDARLTTAREELAELSSTLSPAALEASAEELARDHLRQAYPLVSAATLRQVLHP